MSGLILVSLMTVVALVPFAVTVRLLRLGKTGLALTLVSVLGGCFVVLLYASGRPFGVDPIRAMGWALVFVLPALMGASLGGVLGWLLRRRDDQRS